MKININNLNKRLCAALLAGTMTFTLAGCKEVKNNYNESKNYTQEETEYLNNSKEALVNITDDCEEALKIADIYFDARESNDPKKIKEFYDKMREIYLDYDESKARLANTLLPYFIESEVIFHDSEYAFTEEEMAYVDELYIQDQIINGYTIPEFEKIYKDFIEDENINLEDNYNLSI